MSRMPIRGSRGLIQVRSVAKTVAPKLVAAPADDDDDLPPFAGIIDEDEVADLEELLNEEAALDEAEEEPEEEIAPPKLVTKAKVETKVHGDVALIFFVCAASCIPLPKFSWRQHTVLFFSSGCNVSLITKMRSVSGGQSCLNIVHVPSFVCPVFRFPQ